MEIRPAPIHESQVNIVESDPPQVFVHIKAGLPDACTNFHEIKTERHDNTIDINVTIERLKDKICAQVYTYFGGYVDLGSEFAPGESYTINVNDKMTTFVMP